MFTKVFLKNQARLLAVLGTAAAQFDCNALDAATASKDICVSRFGTVGCQFTPGEQSDVDTGVITGEDVETLCKNKSYDCLLTTENGICAGLQDECNIGKCTGKSDCIAHQEDQEACEGQRGTCVPIASASTATLESCSVNDNNAQFCQDECEFQSDNSYVCTFETGTCSIAAGPQPGTAESCSAIKDEQDCFSAFNEGCRWTNNNGFNVPVTAQSVYHVKVRSEACGCGVDDSFFDEIRSLTSQGDIEVTDQTHDTESALEATWDNAECDGDFRMPDATCPFNFNATGNVSAGETQCMVLSAAIPWRGCGANTGVNCRRRLSGRNLQTGRTGFRIIVKKSLAAAATPAVADPVADPVVAPTIAKKQGVNKTDKKDGFPLWATLLIVGLSLLLACLALILYFCCKKKKDANEAEQAEAGEITGVVPTKQPRLIGSLVSLDLNFEDFKPLFDFLRPLGFARVHDPAGAQTHEAKDLENLDTLSHPTSTQTQEAKDLEHLDTLSPPAEVAEPAV